MGRPWGLRDMTKGQMLRVAEQGEAGARNASPHTFDEWLQSQLKATQLSQRQLAQKSGVDHSTISRLIQGGRTPSLRTAVSLARGLGMPDGGARSDASTARSGSRPAGVEYALRSDSSLDDSQVQAIMDVYLAARRPPVAALLAPREFARRGPVPFVVQVAPPPSRSPAGGPPAPKHRRSS